MDIKPLVAERAFDVTQRRDVGLVRQLRSTVGTAIIERRRRNRGTVGWRFPFCLVELIEIGAGTLQALAEDRCDECCSTRRDENESDERAEDAEKKRRGTELVKRC